jgi:hypothetical protein
VDVEEFRAAKGFIFNDIERELELARASETALRAAGVRPGGGNFLAALGLLCYTEFGGRLKYNRPTASENFNRFFDDLGPEYRAFRQAGHNVYDIFRCGMAHEYMIKRPGAIAMLGAAVPSGVRQLPDGRFEFIVERYYLDLKRAYEELDKQLYGGAGAAP